MLPETMIVLLLTYICSFYCQSLENRLIFIMIVPWIKKIPSTTTSTPSPSTTPAEVTPSRLINSRVSWDNNISKIILREIVSSILSTTTAKMNSKKLTRNLVTRDWNNHRSHKLWKKVSLTKWGFIFIGKRKGPNGWIYLSLTKLKQIGKESGASSKNSIFGERI